MIRKICLMFAGIFFIFFAAGQSAEGGLIRKVNPPIRNIVKPVDRNNDGRVDKKEQVMAQQQGKWRALERSKVNTPLEKKYDSNGDGLLQAGEIREYLKAKHAIVATKGKAKVDSPIEALYDENNDGVIDVGEAVKMGKDLR